MKPLESHKQVSNLDESHLSPLFLVPLGTAGELHSLRMEGPEMPPPPPRVADAPGGREAARPEAVWPSGPRTPTHALSGRGTGTKVTSAGGRKAISGDPADRRLSEIRAPVLLRQTLLPKSQTLLLCV